MKKAFIAIGLTILLIISIFVLVHLVDNKASNSVEVSTDTNYEIKNEIYVDGWLKITKVFEYNGSLAVLAENVSDSDIEYALLTVKNKNENFTFNISALLHETKVILLCNETMKYNPNENYTGWKTENIIYFEDAPVMNEDKFEINVTDGSISIKNISGEDISTDIFIYYKEKTENHLNGSVTHRIRVSGLKANSQTFVKADKLNKDNCQILFTEYDKKI